MYQDAPLKVLSTIYHKILFCVATIVEISDLNTDLTHIAVTIRHKQLQFRCNMDMKIHA
jgi:hypothetical protein